MEKRDLMNLLDEVFIPVGLKRKGNNWVSNNKDVLSKIVNLQKSNYGNSFYINYGYIIKGLPLTTVTHVESRLAGADRDENKKITDLLNLEVDIPADERLSDLRQIVTDKVVSKIQSINTEEDLLNELKKRPHLNDIPLVVKKHFNLGIS